MKPWKAAFYFEETSSKTGGYFDESSIKVSAPHFVANMQFPGSPESWRATAKEIP